MSPVVQVLLKTARVASVVAALFLLLLLVEDYALWFVPLPLLRHGRGSVQSRCEEIKVGMSRSDVLEAMHRGVTHLAEVERGRDEPGREHILGFATETGWCVVHLDPATLAVTGAKFEGPGPISVIQ